MISGNQQALPPLTCAECTLGRLTVYGPTRDSAPNEISNRRRSVSSFTAHKTFLKEGTVPSQTHILYSGWAFRFKQLADGRRQILSFLIPGDVVALENLCFAGLPLPFSVRSLTQISLCTFDTNDMQHITQSSDKQSQKLAAAMRDHVMNMNRCLVDIGRRSALGRVAQLILELESRLRARCLSVDGVFFFPARQEDIADALGLTTVYVNRTLDRLRRDGIIDFSRRRMVIRNPRALPKVAEEE
jgi:CRP/FNR family transcriptional regulator